MRHSLIAAWAVVLAAAAAPLVVLFGRRGDPKWRLYQKLFSRFEEHDGKGVRTQKH